MPTTRMSMRQIKEVLRLKFAAELSHRQIADCLGISVGVVAKYITAATRAGLSYPLPDGMDDRTLLRALRAEAASVVVPRLREPDMAEVHTELKRKGVTRQLLWEEYAAAHPDSSYSYPQFCVLYREWRKRLKLSMRQVRISVKMSKDFGRREQAREGRVRRRIIYLACSRAVKPPSADASIRL